jgi:hypothetical protein
MKLVAKCAFFALVAMMAITFSCYGMNTRLDAATTGAGLEFQLEARAEVLASFTARAPGTSWGSTGAEAAIITCYLDDEYNQDVILFMGESKFTYRLQLGNLARGHHRMRVEVNRKLSSASVGAVIIGQISIAPVLESTGQLFTAMSYSPILYARRNSIGRFTDIPLLMWYEVFHNRDETTIRYSYVFTNEDAGTATEALMARWGRATDIEWAYEVKLRDGKTAGETFQAVNHRPTPFSGKKAGLHPFLLVASDNNNFADVGESAMRLALQPEFMDLSSHSREEMMDRHAWAYRVMAQELRREGKISDAGGHFIRDPRSYVYIEARAPRQNMGIDLRVGLKDGKWCDSDLGRQDLDIQREGWFRVAVRLPLNESPKQTKEIAIQCRGPARTDQPVECTGIQVQKAFMLDQDYRPRLLRTTIEPSPARAFSSPEPRPPR